MFDFVDTSGLSDLAVVFAEADARRDPERELRAPVSMVAGSVVDAAEMLVGRGVLADPGSSIGAVCADPVGAGGGSGEQGSGGGVDVGDLMVAVEAVGRVRRLLAAAESAMVARLEDAEASVRRRGERTTSWLGRAQGLPGWKAAETTRVAVALDATFDKFAAALGRGEIDHGYCAALVRASNERIEEALVDLQDELLARIPGRRFSTWRRELGAVCALLDADGPEPAVGRDDKVFLSETLDGLVDLKGTFSGSTAEEVRQLVEAHTDRLARQARRDAKLAPELSVPSRGVLRAQALLELLRLGSSGGGSGGPETHINLDVEAIPVLAEDGDDSESADRSDQSCAGQPASDGPSPSDGPATPDDRSASAGHPAPADCSAQPDFPAPVGETSRDWFRRVLGQRGDVLAGAARLADTNLWRLLCNPVIHCFVTDSAHEILQMGRAVRLATPAQRRALRVRDGGCVFPGCDAPIGWTQAHHAVHWSKGGRSDLAYMGLLCTAHHDVTHRPDWQMLANLDPAGNPLGTFRWVTPSGEVLWSQRHGEFIP